MATLDLNVKTQKNRKFSVEIDADKLERLAANFGFFNPEFEASLNRAEADYRAGKVVKAESLKALQIKK